jgi:hypothetical protein
MNGFYRSSGRSAKPLIARLKQQAAVLSLCVRAAEKISWRQAALLLRKLQQILRQLLLLRRMVALGLPLAAMMTVLAPAKSWGFSPAGEEFRINSYTTDSQAAPRIAMNSAGNFVVVWQSFAQDGSSQGVYAQRYAASGIIAGGAFRVNTHTSLNQSTPSVAVDADGNFVVVWASLNGQDGSGSGIYGQRYNAAGVAQGSEFKVNTYTTGDQTVPSVAMDADGDFVVTWASNAQDGNVGGIYGQRYNTAGVAQGSEFRINTYTTGNQLSPSVKTDADGDFVVVWQSNNQDGNLNGVYGQRYNAAGVAQGSEFKINTHTTGNQASPSVAVDTDGDFVVVWQSNGQDGSSYGIYGQRYNAAGVAQGAEFRSNTYTTNNQILPQAGMDSDGDFIVVWSSNDQDGNLQGIFGQRYLAGVAKDGEFQINSYATDQQTSPCVGMNATGNFVVAWQSNGQDGSSSGIYAQRYAGLPQFQVNIYTTANQSNPAVAMDDDGDFIVTWRGGGFVDLDGVYGRQYNRAGNATSLELHVNTNTSDHKSHAKVAMDADGDFVVVWASQYQDGNRSGIYAQRFNAAGIAQGGEFLVNTFTTNGQASPEVAMDADGDFVVIWNSSSGIYGTPGQDGSFDGIYAQRYNSAGMAQGGEFRVNTYTTDSQRNAAIAMDPDGDFVVVWVSTGSQDGSSYGIFAQRYDASGNPQGGEFQVNTRTTSSQDEPDVAMDADGDFVVTWESYSQDGSGRGIYAQRFEADGEKQGSEFRVNTYTTNQQRDSQVAMSAEGDFTVVWWGPGQGDPDGIYAQRYNAAGLAQGSEFRVNDVINDTQSIPSIAMDQAGNFVIAWMSNNQDGNNEGIFAQRYAIAVQAPSTPDLDAASDTGNSNSDNITSQTLPTFSGTAPVGSTVYLFEGDTPIASGSAPAGTYSITLANPLTLGAHSIVAVAVDVNDMVSSFSGELTITIVESRYESWKEENFGEDANDPLIAGDDVDPDGDGIANLMEYGLGLDPNISSLAGAPVVWLEGATDRLRLQFDRLSDRNDLNYIVQVSDDLATWTSIAQAVGSDASMTVLGGLAVIVSETGTTTKTVVVEDNTSPAGPAKRFLRLIVNKL